VGAGLDFRQGRFAFQSTVRRTTKQSRTAPLEAPTAGFTMADASVSYRIFTGTVFHDITLVGRNLLDEEARLHTSFLKDLAPLPGREVRLVYRVNF
jgi:iron complex outermembrane receptor protein